MIRFLQTQGPAFKILLGTIIGVFILILVVTLVPGIYDWNSTSNQVGVVAKVAGRTVTSTDAENLAQRIMKQNKLPDTLMAMVLPRAVDNLVGRAVLLDAAGNMGLHVTDRELAAELHTGQFGQTLYPNGQFVGEDRYADFVQNAAHMSVARFESLLKEDLLMQKLQAVVTGAAAVSDADLKTVYDRANAKVKFEYAYFTPEEVAKGIHPTDAELHTFYDHNKARYANSIPEKRQAKYALIDASKVQTSPVTDAELQKYYNDHRTEFQVPERVRVAHILIAPKPGKDGKPDDAAAKAKADDLLKQLKAGGDFAALAKANSDDPGSAQQGGELGWVSRKQTVPEFESAAFGLNPGQLSGVVHSQFGYHIIKGEEKQAAHPQSFDEVKTQIAAILNQQKKAEAMNKYVDQLQSSVRSQGFDNAVKKFGLTPQTTDYFSEAEPVPGLGQAPEFAQAVFQASKGSPVVARVPQGYAIVQVEDIRPPATPTFEQAKAKIASDYEAQQTSELVASKTAQLAQKAAADHDLKKAAQETGAAFKTSDLVTPQSTVPELGAMTASAVVAFSMDKGQVSAPLQNGSTGYVLQVVEKQEPSPEDFIKQRGQLRDQVLAQKRNQSFELFAETTKLRYEKDGKVKYNKDEEKRLGIGAPGGAPPVGGE